MFRTLPVGDAGRGLRTLLGLGLSLVLIVALGTSAAFSNDPRKVLVRDSFDRSSGAGWGAPELGKPWMHPTGRAHVRLVGGQGVMVVNGRGRAEQTTLPTTVRDVTMQFEFSLDEMVGGSGVKVAAVLRKTEAGAYHARVRIGRAGRIWLSVVRVHANGTTRLLGSPVILPQSRYQPGKSMTVRAQAVKQDPTQVRMMAWPTAGTPPSQWQLVRNDRGGNIGAAGRTGLRTQVTGRAARPSAVVRFDNVQLNRAQEAVRVAPTAPSAGRKGQPMPQAAAKVRDRAKPTPVPTPEPVPTNLIVVPDSIDATGSRDVTAELRSLINNAPDDSTIRFKAGGTYRIDSVLFITDKRNVTIDGNGARLDLPREDKGWQSIGFQVRTSTGTTIRDLTMVGNNDRGGTSNTDWSRENNHAILVLSSDDTLIENVDIRRVWGDCLNMRHLEGREGDWSQGLTMRNSSCRLNGRSGVIIHGGTDVVIENNVFDEIGYAVFGFEPDASHEGARDIVFRDNTIGTYSLTSDYRGNVLYACDALWTDGDSTIRNVTLAGNTIEGNRNGKAGEMVGVNVKICGDRGIRENFIVTDNTAAKPVVGPVMKFTDVKGVTVSGNNQPLDSGTLATFPGSTGVNSDA